MSKGAAEKTPATEFKKTETAPSKAKGPTAVAGACQAWGCKHEGSRFNFCDEHYDHFKFGLIKKTGEPVSDYEKKFGHYQAYRSKQKVQKAA